MPQRASVIDISGTFVNWCSVHYVNRTSFAFAGMTPAMANDFPPFKKLRPQSVTSRIQPGSDVIVCAEMDEQWGYVGAKSRQRWLFYAYDRLRKTVVAHVLPYQVTCGFRDSDIQPVRSRSRRHTRFATLRPSGS